MEQNTYIVRRNVKVARDIYSMTLALDSGAARTAVPHGLSRGGQFVDVALEGRFLRRPLAATWWDDECIGIVYKVVGEGTAGMSRLPEGSVLDLLTGLGNGFNASGTAREALVVTGGLGASPVFSLVKEIKAQNKNVTLIMGFNGAEDIVLRDEYRGLGVDPVIVTMDGSEGMKGLVTDAIAALGGKASWDYFYTCGPKVMMKAVCGMMDIPGEASLEERMGCGCGICYGCTCHTTDGPRRICADGPVFPKDKIIW